MAKKLSPAQQILVAAITGKTLTYRIVSWRRAGTTTRSLDNIKIGGRKAEIKVRLATVEALADKGEVILTCVNQGSRKYTVVLPAPEVEATEAPEAQEAPALSQETADAISQRHNVIVDRASEMYTNDDPSHTNDYGAKGWKLIPQKWIDEVTTNPDNQRAGLYCPAQNQKPRGNIMTAASAARDAAQEEKLAEYRASAFNCATSTVTNRPAAEAAAVELLKDYLWWESPKIQWASTPEEAKELVCSRRPDGTQVMAWEDIFWGKVNLVDRINEDALASLRQTIGGYGSTQEAWVARLKMQRNKLLGYPDWNRDNELYLLLRYSTVNVVDDIGILATYLSAERAGIVRYRERTSRNLMLHEELLRYCFAIYLKPKPYAGENIVLLEKPKQIWVESGKLIDIKW